MPATDSAVQVQPDGAGRKIATEQYTRKDGVVVEVQQVVASNAQTGLPLDAPREDEMLALLRMILTELRVLNTMLAEEIRVPQPDLADLREALVEEIVR